ncbi:MAG: hypothetical protein JJE13_09570 [Thermoleophilia bacterium]|nr:hypothetical protein [Thermoleophilia bacterium]
MAQGSTGPSTPNHRELGTEGLDAFREAKHIHMDSVIEVKDWWYPYG